MRLRLETGAPGRIRWGIIWAALFSGATLLMRLGIRPPGFCPFHRLTGHPCPACGGTRALIEFSMLRFRDAFVLQPLVTVFLAGFLIWAAISLAGREPQLQLSRGERRGLIGVLLVLGAVNWVYLWVRGV